MRSSTNPGLMKSDELAAATEELARRIAAASAFTLATGKRAFYRQLDVALPEAYAFCEEVMTENAVAADAQEGIRSVAERRDGVFTGA